MGIPDSQAFISAQSAAAVNEGMQLSNKVSVPLDHGRIDPFILRRILVVERAANGGSRKPEMGCPMSTRLDATLAAIGRELSVAYLPTVREPLPRELADLVAQLVAFEMRERGSGARSAAALQCVMAQQEPDPAPPIR
jgi:hypothetical protein